ncbi:MULTISPECIES: hypothetical protein [unclassified Bifidobacterium]|uniref:hypothetical protein n=1 Tax=unclassified Bifidobacterium TaxID=2608897 RepID=UPI00117BD576|nr:hypothetical protein [Bifidobacterium sp. N5G01]MBS7035888.1 hypothetical protein [Bifidobacterium sp.]
MPVFMHFSHRKQYIIYIGYFGLVRSQWVRQHERERTGMEYPKGHVFELMQQGGLTDKVIKMHVVKP